MITIEDFDEFTERMDCGKPRFIKGRWLYANGAQSNGVLKHGEPPDDPITLVRLKMEFVNSQLEQKTRSYDLVRGNVETQLRFNKTGSGPAPRPGWKQYLTQAKAEIEELFKQYTALKEQLPIPPKPYNYAEELRKEQEELRKEAQEEGREEDREDQEVLEAFPRFDLKALKRSLPR